MASFFDVASTAKGWEVILKCKLLSSSCVCPPPGQDFGAIQFPLSLPAPLQLPYRNDGSLITYACPGENSTKRC